MEDYSCSCRTEDIVNGASQQPEPAAALQELLSDLVKCTGANAGRIYRLSLAESAYIVQASYGQWDDTSPKIHVPLLIKKRAVSLLPVEQVILSRETLILQNNGEKSVSRLLAPIQREGSSLGAIELLARNRDHFTNIQRTIINTAAAFALLLFQKKDTLDLFRALQEPIDYTQARDDFLEDIILLIAQASGMKFIALRELDQSENILRCIALWGFEERAKSEFNLTPIEAFAPFNRAIERRETVVVNDETQLSAVRNAIQDERIKSFVVTPVKVGNEIFGLLSFAAECSYNYTTLELKGFETIANAIGISILNHRHFQESRSISYDQGSTGAAYTAVEVAQAARHEVRSYVQEIQEGLTIIYQLSQTVSKKNVDTIRHRVDDISDKLIDIGISLDKIKNITKPPANELTNYNLNDLWEEALKLVSGRLDVLNIKPIINGPRCDCYIYPDLLRHAFLNLILNSIDAFRNRRIKGNRQIMISIDKQSKAAREVKIRYTDNATGIDISQLRSTDNKRTLTINNIFDIGVTSKTEGSGYGLFLVRKILDRHKGSIDLVSYRNGIAFDINLPKQQVKE